MTPEISSVVIDVKDVSKIYGTEQVLSDLTFSIERGKVVALIGPNGAGKTTLARLLLSLETPTRGTIRIDGAAPQKARGRIGYVPQRFTFDRSLPITVREFLLLPACAHPAHQSYQSVENALADVDLVAVIDQRLGTLSGGQFQRVMIARALMHKKDILVLDEPTTGIDVGRERTVYDLIMRLNQEHHCTILFISHELDVVFRYAEEVLCINKRLVCHGPPQQVLSPRMLEEMYGHFAGAYHHHCEHGSYVG